jgi:hypothetical protein
MVSGRAEHVVVERNQLQSCRLKPFFVTLYTVRKAKRDARPQDKGDGKFRHPYRYRGPISDVDGFFRSFYVDDGIFRHPRVLVLRPARLF